MITTTTDETLTAAAAAMIQVPPAAAAGEIRLLLHGVDESNFDATYRELCEFVDWGCDGCVLLLQTCLDEVKLTAGDMENLQLRRDLLSAIFRYCLEKTHFSTSFCQALRMGTVSEQLLEDLSDELKLSVAERIGIGLALSDYENPDLRLEGQKFAIARIEELCSHTTISISNEQVHDIIVFLYRSDGLSKHLDALTEIISLLKVKERPFFAPSPVLRIDSCAAYPSRHLELCFGSVDDDFESYLAEIGKETSMADVMIDFGYGSTVDIVHCKEILSRFEPFNDVTVAKLLGAIARTHSGLGEAQNTYATFMSAIGNSSVTDSSQLNTWNIDVLVNSIIELAPTTNWTNVIENLDHEGFNIPDEAAFNLLMSIFSHACQDLFPLHAVCGSLWKNTEGQLSFLKYAISAPADIFTFAHSSRQLVFPGLVHLKQGNQAWLCLDLLEVLCQLAELGHASTVRLVLEYPLTHCPEVLLIGIGHVKTAYNLLQYEVLSRIFPVILKDATKSIAISYLWQVNPHLALRGFLDVHTDPNCLLSIADICQDLKILSSVLDSASFSFSIKLAAIAFWKDHIGLENWLTGRIDVYKDAFCEECVKFLKENNSEAIIDGADITSQQSQTTVTNIYHEISPIFTKVLQFHSGQLLSNQLVDEITLLHATYESRNRAAAARHVATSDGSPDDVETEANTYFHQMFSEQLHINDMVDMLAHFKVSSDTREVAIYNCMIANLFEEYKFFPKYPDKQLKLAAVLFGSLIKRQLVTHLTLGIALRGVLDALRKSVDSKMFMFGTKALEQFKDRLVEWPQYCNHILQISHLRGTHAELVSEIELALARISSSQNESNGGNSLAAEQHGPGPASLDNVEAAPASWQQSLSSNSSQTGRQISPFPLQPRQQALLDDKTKALTVANQSKQFSSAQLSFGPSSIDSTTNQRVTVTQPLHVPPPPPATTPATTTVNSAVYARNLNQTTSGQRQGFGLPFNIETLVAAAEQRDTLMEVPPSEIQDKVLFMINNISASNVESKAKEFNEVWQEQYYTWFAQYMVMKRASIEPNFHELYLSFFDKVNSKLLNKEIVKATYENCKVLLRSDLIKSSSEERSLLKNLGSWLGKFTIGRNQALRAKEIDLKALIVGAYEEGLMIAVIPFTSKVLEPCHSSIAYRPPNPWTMGILSLLVEIYSLPNLKMNLKFDIEVLFKNLKMEMKDVKPTSLLKDKVRKVEGNPDFSNKDVTASQPPVPAEVSSGLIPPISHVNLQTEINNTSRALNLPNILNQYTPPVHLSPNTMVEDDKVPLMMPEQVGPHNLTHISPSPSPAPSQSPFSLNQLLTAIPRADIYFRINSKLSSLGPQLQYNKIMDVAMDKAIKEIISPVIKRSVTIASRTTKDLISKDYAMEPDDTAIIRSAHLMVGTLAGSLAHVTCKEPLRVALQSHLRNLIQAINNSETNEQIINLLINDNLDLGCALIESVASRKAVELIDSDIGQSFAQLRKQREAAGSAYYEAFTYAQGPFARVPEALRPKPGQLSVPQQRVYEDFINVWHSQSSQNPSATAASPPGSGGSSNASITRAYSPNSAPLASNSFSNLQIAPISSVAQAVDLTSEELDNGSAQLSSVAAAQVETNNSSSLNVGGINNDIPVGEMSIITKDMGTIVPPSLTTAADRFGSVPSEPLTTGDALDKYQHVSQKMEALIAKDVRDIEIQSVVAEVPDILLRCISRDEAALAVAQKVFKSLYENASNGAYVAWLLVTLVAIRDVCKLVVKELTSWVIYSDEEKKFNIEITIGLIRSELLNLGEYNVHLAKLIDGGRNKAATEFVMLLVQTLVTQESGVIISELYNVVDALAKLATSPGSPESLQQLVEIARNNANNTPSFTAGKEEKARQSRDKKVLSGRPNKDENIFNDISLADPAGFQDQVALLFSEWSQICDHPVINDAAYSHYVAQLQQSGLLKGDDITERFFRILTDVAVAHSLVPDPAIDHATVTQQSSQQFQLSYFPIDSYAKLVVMVLKYSSVDQGSKAILLPKVLSVAARVIQRDTEEKKLSFNPRPYFRLFINWLADLVTSDPNQDAANFQVLTSFANTFYALQPLRVPGWSFAWLELVSHRSFMPKLLMCNSQKGWPFFQRLLIGLFKFMEPYLRNAELAEPVHFLYKGTLRVLLVLLHDFPEFLCDYHFSFCDVIPSSCIQMRNVILSAFPRNMRLPDPSTPNLKIDLLAEISITPRIMSDVDGALKVKQMKAEIDEYLKTEIRPVGSPFLNDLKQKLLLPQSEANLAGTRYNVPLVNSLVLYVGMQAIQQQPKTAASHASAQQINHSPPIDIFMSGAMDIFLGLINNLDTEGRYLFLNAIANQLRYPNKHTHYFSFIILFLFAEANQEIIQEQITRVLLERLIVNRPHPWGLLITFIELIKNPRYNFWNKSFTRCAPEIEKLFESVARSCAGKTVDDGIVPGVPDAGH